MRFHRSHGLTESEKVLAELCDRSFLSLWSYPNLYRKPAKELADLLVVFGDDVLIFSDKSCAYPAKDDAGLNWRRWFAKSIADSARQLTQAERWITTQREHVYLDVKCETKLPLPLPPTDRMRIHRIAIALGCKENGEKRDLAVVPDVTDDQTAYAVGKISNTAGRIHVFNDWTLSVVMKELSTVSDFVDYLRKKEQLLDSGKLVQADSELDMLAHFLWNGRDFKVPDGRFRFEPNLWAKVDKSPEFQHAREENKPSVFWDRLIDHFTQSYMKEELEFGNEASVSDHERSVRFMAEEHRFGRRLLTNWILDRSDVPPHSYAGSLFRSPTNQDVTYVLLVGPGAPRPEYDAYRKLRSRQLYGRCVAAKAAVPASRYIVGIGLDRRGVDGGSEDLFFMDTGNWDQAALDAAEKLRNEMDYFVSGKSRQTILHKTDYPTPA